MEEAVEPLAGVPVWSHDGIVCTGETYKKVVKLTFAQGASFPIRQASSMPAWKAHAPGDRHPRRREGGRARVQGAHQGRGGAERRLEEEVVHEHECQGEVESESKKASSSFPAAIRRSRRPTATPRCRPTSPRYRAGSARSVNRSMRSSRATCPR